MIKKFVCLGNLNIDITFIIDRMPEEHEKLGSLDSFIEYGGAASNTAYWLSKLGHSVQMIGCVGEDALGKMYLEHLENIGIEINAIQKTNKINTSILAIFANANSKRMLGSKGASKFLDVTKIKANIFDSSTHLHISYSNYDTVLDTLQKAKKRGSSTSIELKENYDFNIIKLCDYCFINNDDFQRWFGKDNPEKFWLNICPNETIPYLVLTKGKSGAQLIGKSENCSTLAYPTDVIDRTGGGDAFNAGFLHSIFTKKDFIYSLDVGLRLASEVISYLGARPKDVKLPN